MRRPGSLDPDETASLAARSLGRLLADTEPAVTTPVPDTTSNPGESRGHGRADGRLWRRTPSHGRRTAGSGWAPAGAPVTAYRMTTDQAPVMWPFIPTPPLPPTGAQMGIDEYSGGVFHADPAGWVTDPAVPVTNPNVFVFGKPGRGKSATVKAFCLRMMAYGYSTLILGDPKDEYEPLCRALGVEPFRIGHGLPARINPLAFGPLEVGWHRLSREEATARAAVVFARWLTLLRGLIGAQRLGAGRVPFGPTEEAVLTVALAQLTGYDRGATHLVETTIPALWHALHHPSPELIGACRYADARHFLDDTRLLRDALGQLVTGALAGLFDAPTTIAVDWAAPIQSLSLSRLEPLGDDAVGIALLCLTSWGRAHRELAAPGERRVVVRDESWRQLRLGVEAVKAFDADLRLSRRDGDVHVAVAHKPADLLTAGDTGSQAVAIAKDLLHLADTLILHGQDQAVADDLANLVGLPPMAVDLVTGWAMQGTGRALWRVGDRAYKVRTILHPIEYSLAETNLPGLGGGRGDRR